MCHYFKNYSNNDHQVCYEGSLTNCPPQAIPQKLLKSPSSNLAGTVTSSNTRMHHVLIILTVTFIQGQKDRNHEKNKCLIISKTIQATTIKFTVKVVRLRVYIMTIASPMTLTFIQDHKCASNLTTF